MRAAWLHRPYTDAPDRTVTCYLEPDVIEAHLQACTEAQVTAEFHIIGDAAVSAVVAAFEGVVVNLKVGALARCRHRLEHIYCSGHGSGGQTGRSGLIASVQLNFDVLWDGGNGTYAPHLGVKRCSELNLLALLASHGMLLALDLDIPVTSLDLSVSVQAAVNHYTPGSAVSARATFAGATRGGWWAGVARDGKIGALVSDKPVSYAVWDAEAIDVGAPRYAVQQRSPDLRSWVPRFPWLGSTDAVPRCCQTVPWGAVI